MNTTTALPANTAQNLQFTWTSAAGVPFGNARITFARTQVPYGVACAFQVNADGTVQIIANDGYTLSAKDDLGTAQATDLSNSSCTLHGAASQFSMNNGGAVATATLNVEIRALLAGQTVAISTYGNPFIGGYRYPSDTQVGTVAVTGPGFNASATQAFGGANSTTTSTITIAPLNGFSGPVTFTPGSWPAGITATFSPNPATTAAAATISVGPQVGIGTTFTLPVTATSGALSTGLNIALTSNYQAIPATGSGAVGVAQNFTFNWIGTDGIVYFQDASLPAPSGSFSNGCFLHAFYTGAVQFDPLTNNYLNDFVGQSFALTVSDSYCQLNGLASAPISSGSYYPSIIATLNMQFNPIWGGKTIAIYMSGSGGTLQLAGTFTLAPSSLPSFTLTATNATVQAGFGSGTSTVAVVPASGFNSPVTLSATNWPSGITAAFGTNPATGSSVVTITAASTVPIGTYQLTVTGSSGSLSATKLISLYVGSPPSFDIGFYIPGIYDSQSVPPGATLDVPVFVTGSHGFNSPVTLSTPGWPTGITGTFSANPTLGQYLLLSIHCDPSVPVGSYPLPIVGTGGGLTELAAFTVTVSSAAQYVIAATPVTIPAGGSGVSNVTVIAMGGITGPVNLSAIAYYTNGTVDWAFDVNPTVTTSHLTLTVPSTVAPGTYLVSVYGTVANNFPGFPKDYLVLTVTAPVGTLPYGVSVTPSAGSGTVSTFQNFQFAWASSAGQPILFSGSVLIQDSAISAPNPVYSCYIQEFENGAAFLADDTGSIASAAANYLGYPGAFLAANSHCRLDGPGSGKLVVANGGASLRSTMSLIFNPVWVGKTLAIWMQALDVGSQTGSWKQLGTFQVLSGQSFWLSATAATALAGAAGTSTVTVNSIGNFNAPVTLSTLNWPAEITGTFATNPATGTSVANISVAPNVVPGLYSLTVNGVSGSLSSSAVIVLSVSTSGSTLPYGVSVTPAAGSGPVHTAQNLDFVWGSPAGQPVLAWGSVLIQDSSLSTPTPANACYLKANSTGAMQLADDTGSFAGAANNFIGNPWAVTSSNAHCQLNGLASGKVTATNGGASLESLLNLQFSSAWAGKTLAIWIQGTNTNYKSGNWQQLGTFTVSPANTGSFTLSATNSSAAQGINGTSTITVTPANGFNSPVTLSAVNWPSGITGTFGTNPAIGTSVVTISVGAGVPLNLYSLTVTGVSGALSASTTISLQVQSFSLSATSATATAGASGTSTVTVTQINNANLPVTLSTSGWPNGITGTFGTNPATNTSVVTINVASTVAVGTYSLTVSGASGPSLTAGTTIPLTVSASGGGTLPYGVSVTPAAGNAAANTAANLAFAWASPNGQPALTWGSIIIQDSAVSTPTAASACYLRMNGGGSVQLGDDAGTLGGNNFAGNPWALTTSNAHCQLNGLASAQVSLTNGGANLQSTLNLQFASVWAGKTLSIWLQGTNTNYQSGTWQKLGTFTVSGTAPPPSFTLGATPAGAVQAGSTGSSTVSLVSANGFNSNVTLAATGWPAGITGSFTTNPLTQSVGTSAVAIAVGASVAPGSYSLTVTGTSGTLSATVTVALTVTASGGGTLPYGVSVTPSAGSATANTAQNLQFIWAAPAGQPALTWGSIIIQDSSVATPTAANACYLRVNSSGAVELANDPGTTLMSNIYVGEAWAPNSSNAHCQLNGPPSSKVTVSGTNTQVTLNLQFASVWAGKTLSIWMQGTNTNYQSGTWQQLGTLQVQ